LVIRPSFHTYRNRFFFALLVCAVVGAIDLVGLRRRPAQLEVEAIVFALMAITLVTATLLVFRREEMKVAGGVLTRRNMLGIPTRYPLDRIGGMTRRDVMFIGSRQPARLVVVYDKDNRCLFTMSRLVWDPSDVRRLHARLGGDGRTRLVTSGELAEEFPRSVPWIVQHPLVLSGLTVVVTIGVLVLLLMIGDAMTHR
jgi:hypothetical protein